MLGNKQETEKEYVELLDQAKKLTDGLKALFEGDLKDSLSILGLEGLDIMLREGGDAVVEHMKSVLTKVEKVQAIISRTLKLDERHKEI